jgi:hypothetical protein
VHTRQTVSRLEPKMDSLLMDTYSTPLRAFRGPRVTRAQCRTSLGHKRRADFFLTDQTTSSKHLNNLACARRQGPSRVICVRYVAPNNGKLYNCSPSLAPSTRLNNQPVSDSCPNCLLILTLNEFTRIIQLGRVVLQDEPTRTVVQSKPQQQTITQSVSLVRYGRLVFVL